MSLTLITMLKRRPGMRWREFHDLYEQHHSLIADAMLAGFATRYEWRYLRALDGRVLDHDYDVILEIDFVDQGAVEACFARLAESDLLDKVIAAEERLFDRDRIRVFTVQNHQWPMRSLRPNGRSANDT